MSYEIIMFRYLFAFIMYKDSEEEVKKIISNIEDN